MFRVLFVCIGNSCRSQMAEGFARAHGEGLLHVESAGLAPAMRVAPDTQRAMLEKGIDISDQFSKDFRFLRGRPFDLIVNMSGYPMPDGVASPVVEWKIADPIGESMDVYREVREQIARRVLSLIEDIRREKPSSSAPAAP